MEIKLNEEQRLLSSWASCEVSSKQLSNPRQVSPFPHGMTYAARPIPRRSELKGNTTSIAFH
jgi:hypothetical protein